MGRRIQMSSLHRTIFLSADNSKSRRCLEYTLKVVVVKYVVENKIDGMYTIYDSFGREKRILKAGFVQISNKKFVVLEKQSYCKNQRNSVKLI
jgi:hypothetical protein